MERPAAVFRFTFARSICWAIHQDVWAPNTPTINSVRDARSMAWLHCAYQRTSHGHRLRFPLTMSSPPPSLPRPTTRCLDPDYRRPLVLRELLAYHADVVCLQEVDERTFTDYLRLHLGLQGEGDTVACGLVRCVGTRFGLGWP